MSKQSALIKNTLIIAFGKLSTQFLTFLLLPLYTSYLTTKEFGAVDLLLTYASLLTPLLMLSMEMAVFRFLIDVRDDENGKKCIITNAFQIASCGAILAIAFCLASSFFATTNYGPLITGAIVTMIFSNFFLQTARGIGNNLQYAVGGIVTGITTIIVNLVLIVGMGWGADGMLLAAVIGNFSGAAYLFTVLKLYRYISPRARDRNIKRQLLGYSIPLVPNNISWWLINAADRTIITLLLGVASNGVYAVAYRFPLIFNGLFSFFGMSWTESAAVNINSPDRDSFFSQIMNASVKLFGSIGFVIISAVPIFFPLLVDESFDEAYQYIPLLIIGSFFNSIVGVYSAIYIAKKLTRQVMNTSIIAAAISIGFTLIFVRVLGVYAAAIAMILAYFFMAVFRHYDVRKYVQITYQKSIVAILCGVYTVVCGAYYAGNQLTHWLILGATIVVAALFNWRVIRALARTVISRIFRKRN